MTKLLAYHNDPAIKSGLIASLKAHAKADRIIHGRYWQNGKGCAVGCQSEFFGLAQHDNHTAMSKKTGWAVMLVRLEDKIFEGLPNGKAQKWPIQFSQAIKPGADLSRVCWKFLHWLLMDSDLLHDGGREDVKSAIKQCAAVLVPLTQGLPVDKIAARAAATAAWDARGAAREARAAGATWVTEEAARAAEAAARAAVATWVTEEAARAAEAAARAAKVDAYERMAEKLIRLLRAAK
jgi:hypothetical protein